MRRDWIFPLYKARFICLFASSVLDLLGKWYDVLMILLMAFFVLRWIGEVFSVGFSFIVEVCQLARSL